MADAPQGDDRLDVTMTYSEYLNLAAALRRATRVVKELNYRRGSDDIERARAGTEHELETAMQILGLPVEHVTGQLMATGERPAEQLPLA
jgi:hypothetical protein